MSSDDESRIFLDRTEMPEGIKNTNEKMYLLSKSAKRQSKYLGTGIGGFVGLILFLMLFTFSFYDSFETFGELTVLDGEQCAGGPDLDIMEEELCYIFVPHEGTIPSELVAFMYQTSNAMYAWMWVWVTFAAIPLVYTYLRLRKINNQLQDITDEYIRDSYFLNVELNNPEGENRMARMFNLVNDIFPEVAGIRKKIDLKQKDIEGYKFDFLIETDVGKIGVIFFEEIVTFDNLKEFDKKIGKSLSFPTRDDRVLCFAEQFSKDFDVENLEEKMDELVGGIGHIDLIKENKPGYSVIWID